MAFQPNQQNVNGQPRPKLIRDALVALISRPGSDKLDDEPKTIAQELAISLVKSARSGDAKALTEVMDRTDGKPAQAIIGGEDGDKPLFPEKRYLTIIKPDGTTETIPGSV